MAKGKNNQTGRSEGHSNALSKSERSTNRANREFDGPLSSLPGPYDLMHRLGVEMDRLFADLGLRRGLLSNVTAPLMERPFLWTPEVEVLERNGQLLIRADLPGLNKDEIKIDLADDALTIEGERKQENEETGEGFYRSERRYGHFHRRIPLPAGVDIEKVKAKFNDGVLEVAMPVSEAKERKVRKIEITDGSVAAKAKAAGR